MHGILSQKGKPWVLNLFPVSLAYHLSTISEDIVLVSFNCQLDITERPLRKESPQRDAQTELTCVPIYGRLSSLVINVGDLSPLWEAPFPRQEVLSCIRKLPPHKPMSKPARSTPLGFQLQVPVRVPVLASLSDRL